MTKLEQVARAIFAQWRKQMDNDGRSDLGPISYEAMNGQERGFGLTAARAAVEALRNPNDATRNALSRACSTDCFAGCDCGGVWDVGIDAILSEKPEQRDEK